MLADARNRLMRYFSRRREVIGIDHIFKQIPTQTRVFLCRKNIVFSICLSCFQNFNIKLVIGISSHRNRNQKSSTKVPLALFNIDEQLIVADSIANRRPMVDFPGQRIQPPLVESSAAFTSTSYVSKSLQITVSPLRNALEDA